MDQKSAWMRINQDQDAARVVESFHHPHESQSALRDVIDGFAHNHPRVIEVGCGTGVTSLLLNTSYKKTLLDFDPRAVELAHAAARRLDQPASCIVADMFRMPIRAGSFDLVFSSGVIEHYDQADRVRILSESARILDTGGIIITAFPNHYSLPYRSAYLFFKRLLRGFRWSYPREYKLYDLHQEIAENNLILEKRLVLAKQGAFYFWGRYRWSLPVQKILLLLDKFLHFEGYLTVVLLRKRALP